MHSLYDFIVKPVDDHRYNNKKEIAGVQFVTNTSLESFKNVNRQGVVIAVPKAFDTPIKPGDIVIIHHNVFRRFYDVRGKEKNSRSYMFDGMYAVSLDQIYAYQPLSTTDWRTFNDYCFVQPVKSTDESSTSKEKELHGILRYTNKKLNIEKGETVCFTPDSEFEFVFNDMLLYCMKLNNIVLSYGIREGDEEYNPSWTR
jgi:hypothetical protein